MRHLVIVRKALELLSVPKMTVLQSDSVSQRALYQEKVAPTGHKHSSQLTITTLYYYFTLYRC